MDITQGTPFLDRCAAALRAYCAARISGAGPPSVVEHWRGLSAVRTRTHTHVEPPGQAAGEFTVCIYMCVFVCVCLIDNNHLSTLVSPLPPGAVGCLGAGGGRAQDNGVHTRGAAAARLQPKHAPLPLRHGRRCGSSCPSAHSGTHHRHAGTQAHTQPHMQLGVRACVQQCG